MGSIAAGDMVSPVAVPNLGNIELGALGDHINRRSTTLRPRPRR